MTRMIGIRIICVAAAVILALASIFGVAKLTTDPAFYQKSIAALEEKQETVLELTAASTAASAAITLLPGDTATPIADKLADLSGYFLIVLCAIFLEKYLLTITAAAAFKVLIPAACAAFAAAALFPRLRRTAGALAWKLTLFSIAIMLVIPTGIRVSDLIEDTYQASIAATIQEAKDATDTIQNSQSENAETEQSGLSGFFSKVTDKHYRRRSRCGGEASECAEPLFGGSGSHAGDHLPDPDSGAAVFRVVGKTHFGCGTAAAGGAPPLRRENWRGRDLTSGCNSGRSVVC